MAILDQDADDAAAVAAKLDGATHEQVHVTHGAEVERAIGHLEGWANGGLHGLVNCAGIVGISGRPSHEIDARDFVKVLEVNLIGAFRPSHAVLPGMVERDYGHILHVSSIAGKEGNAGMVSYSASKAADRHGEVTGQGVRGERSHCALAPGVSLTDMVDAMS